MKTPILSLVAAAAVLAMAACSSNDNPAAPVITPPSTDRYVDQSVGNNGDDGSSRNPWKTITYAVATADSDVTIHVAPGTYDGVNGETFPIQLKKGQSIIGDVANKGAGTSPTVIRGEAPYAVGILIGTAVVGTDHGRVAGFRIENTSHTALYVGVVADAEEMEIDHNTFPVTLYGGIGASNGADVDAHDNVFQATDYGLVIDGSGIVTVHNNIMDAERYGIRAFVVDSLDVANNTMTAIVYGGVQGNFGTSTRIHNNTFDKAAGNYGSILAVGGSPVIRNNTFTGGVAIYVQSAATPDAGTSASPGQNDFSAVTGPAINHTGTGTVMAVGNTWAHDPPTLGVDYLVTGGGTVVTQ